MYLNSVLCWCWSLIPFCFAVWHMWAAALISLPKSDEKIKMERCTKETNTSYTLQYIQKEECAYLYKCIWWASVICQARFCTLSFFFVCFFLPCPKDLWCVEEAVCDGGKIISLQTWKNVSCDMKYRCTKHKGPRLSKRLLVFFPHFLQSVSQWLWSFCWFLRNVILQQ